MITLNIVELAAVCGMVVTIAGAAAVLYKPFRVFNAKVSELDRLSETLCRLEQKTAERCEAQDAYNATMTRAVTALLLHAMSGNETGEMKKAYDEIRDWHLCGHVKL